MKIHHSFPTATYHLEAPPFDLMHPPDPSNIPPLGIASSSQLPPLPPWDNDYTHCARCLPAAALDISSLSRWKMTPLCGVKIMGVARENRVLRDTHFLPLLPHPSVNGTRGYDIPFHQMIVDTYRARNPALEGMRTIVWYWMTNGVVPLWMIGNKPSSALSGEYLLLLVLFKLIWPQATGKLLQVHHIHCKSEQ